MLLNKTGKARDALGAGSSAGLSLQERRILILTDGKRSLNEVMAMLGADILPAMDRLMREGYIAGAAPEQAASASQPAFAGAVTGLLRAATDAVQARTGQIRANAPPADGTQRAIPAASAVEPVPAARSATGTRRSLAASKMYLLDMLQLQRSAESIDLRATIQCASGQAALLDALFDALHLLVASSTRSYGDRIQQRLCEILPEEALPRLQALRTERAESAPLSIVAA